MGRLPLLRPLFRRRFRPCAERPARQLFAKRRLCVRLGTRAERARQRLHDPSPAADLAAVAGSRLETPAFGDRSGPGFASGRTAVPLGRGGRGWCSRPRWRAGRVLAGIRRQAGCRVRGCGCVAGTGAEPVLGGQSERRGMDTPHAGAGRRRRGRLVAVAFPDDQVRDPRDGRRDRVLRRNAGGARPAVSWSAARPSRGGPCGSPLPGTSACRRFRLGAPIC